MSGLDEILNNITGQQKLTEDSIIRTASAKAEKIIAEGKEKAEAAYNEHIARDKEKYDMAFGNACNAAQAAAKRKLLACRVECIQKAIDRVLEKLRGLPDDEYFDVLLRLADRNLRSGDGVMMLNKKDLERMTYDFEEKLSELAEKKGGKITISKEPVPIDSGFMLQYGLITENCSFDAIIEAEKDGIRDTAAKELFG